MHIICTICSDLVNPAENIHVTQCGHIFHYQCLSQWISRSKSCPQCRNKVTNKGTYRLYPTVSNEMTADDAATLQSRLDDAHLQLRQQKTEFKEKEEKLMVIEKDLKKNGALLKATEKKLESKESAVSALKDQLEYLKVQNRETQKLKEENDILKNKMKTLTGLEKVLNATSNEVEELLECYKDVKTVATFATALKRALCECESKKNQIRDELQILKQQLAAEKIENARLEGKIVKFQVYISQKEKEKDKNAKGKRKSLNDDSWQAVKKPKTNNNDDSSNTEQKNNDNNISIASMVNRIENADSPYLCLKQSSLALTALQRHPTHPLPEKNLKPSEYALLKSARNAIKTTTTDISKTSIFHKKEPVKIPLSQENDPNMSLFNISYDGLGGHSKHDNFPKNKNLVPKLSAKHKLKRPNPVRTQDISEMLSKIKDSCDF